VVGINIVGLNYFSIGMLEINFTYFF
jgi:hypothetical protein